MGRITRVLDSFTRSNPAAAAATRSFVTGPAVIDRAQSQFRWMGDDQWSPKAFGEYVAISNAVYAAVKMRYTLLSSLPLKFYTGTGDAKKEVTSGPVVDLFSSVNPFWTFDRLMQMTEQSLCLWGKCFWFIEKGGNSGLPKQLWWARPDQVRVVRSAANYVDHFLLDPQNGNDPIRFETDETFWLRTPNPIDEFEGLSPVAAVRVSADTAISAMQSNYNIFRNGIQAGGFFSPKPGGPNLTSEQADQLNEQMNRRFKGVDKAHRWGTFAFPVDITTIAMSPRDAEFLGALNWSLEEVCRAFGVPIDLIGGQRTYANVDASERIIWTHAIRPEADFIAAEITEQILPMFGVAGLTALFDYTDVEVLREAQSDAWLRESDQINRGVLMINEWRKDKGMKPVPWGDVWWAPVGLVPVRDDSDPTPAPVVSEKIADALPPGPDQNVDPNVPDPKDKALNDGTAPKALKPGETAPRRRTRTAMAYGSPEHRAAFQRFVGRTEKHEKAVGDTTADLMRRQKQAVLAQLRNGRALNRDAAEADDFPFNRARWIKVFRETIKPVLAEIVKDAGDAALADLDIGSAFDLTDPNVRKFLMQRAQRFAVEVNETTWEQLKASLGDGMDAGEGIDQLAQRVNDVMGDRIRSSGEVIARTEALGAANGGAILSWKGTDVVRGKTWLAALDDRTRPDHQDAHGQEVGLDEDFEVGDASGPGPGMMGDPAQDCNCRCFPGDTTVYAEGVYAASMRWYEGPIATVTTGDGRIITATPNHPVLTRRGWVAIGDLDNRDDLIGYRLREDLIAANPNPDERPTSFAEKFRLLTATGRGKRMVGAVPDFHGDGTDHEVYVVRAESDLRHGIVPALSQPSAQDVLSVSNGIQRGLFARDTGNTRGIAEPLALGKVGSGHPCDHRLTSIAGRDTGFFESGNDAATGDIKLSGQRLDGSTLVVSGDQRGCVDSLAFSEKENALSCLTGSGEIANSFVGGHGGHAELAELRASSQRHASTNQLLPDGGPIGANFLGDSGSGFPGEITANNVVSVQIGPFRGHVYNLHTESGWYLADGIIAHNCSMTAVLDTDA